MDMVSDHPEKRFVEISVPIRFGDTDPYGVVYFVSYFRYCHHGIEEFFRQLGLQPQDLFRNREDGFGLPIVGAACDFLKPVRYGEFVRLRISVLKMSEKALTFAFHFYPLVGEECVARGRATLVAIDQTWKSRALPDVLKAAVKPYL